MVYYPFKRTFIIINETLKQQFIYFYITMKQLQLFFSNIISIYHVIQFSLIEKKPKLDLFQEQPFTIYIQCSFVFDFHAWIFTLNKFLTSCSHTNIHAVSKMQMILVCVCISFTTFLPGYDCDNIDIRYVFQDKDFHPTIY